MKTLTRREFARDAMKLLLIAPFIRLRMDESQEDENPIEVLDKFESGAVYTADDFNGILEAIRQLQRKLW